MYLYGTNKQITENKIKYEKYEIYYHNALANYQQDLVQLIWNKQEVFLKKIGIFYLDKEELENKIKNLEN